MHKNRTDALLHRYIKEIRKNLPCPTEEEKRALDNLKESVSAYLFEYPEATAEDIAQRFGAPTQIADSFLDVEGISRSVKKHSRLQRTILGILAVAVLVAIIQKKSLVRLSRPWQKNLPKDVGREAIHTPCGISGRPRTRRRSLLFTGSSAGRSCGRP